MLAMNRISIDSTGFPKKILLNIFSELRNNAILLWSLCRKTMHYNGVLPDVKEVFSILAKCKTKKNT